MVSRRGTWLRVCDVIEPARPGADLGNRKAIGVKGGEVMLR